MSEISVDTGVLDPIGSRTKIDMTALLKKLSRDEVIMVFCRGAIFRESDIINAAYEVLIDREEAAGKALLDRLKDLPSGIEYYGERTEIYRKLDRVHAGLDKLMDKAYGKL